MISRISGMNVIRKIAQGRAGAVYEADDNGTRYGVKVFFDAEDFHNEVAVQQTIPDHINLHKMIYADDKGIYTNPRTNREQTICYIKTPYCEYEDIFQLLMKPKRPVPGPIVRYLISQILSGLDALHGSNIAHCDIKPQNCLLNQNLELKLGDFESSNVPMNAVKGMRGTAGYMMPECANEEYDGQEADYYALGATTFVLVTGRPMFSQSNKKDKFFKHILNNDFDSFWKAHKLDTVVHFKEFIEKFVDADPSYRMKCSDEVRAHPYMLKRTAPKEEVLKYVKRIYNC